MPSVALRCDATIRALKAHNVITIRYLAVLTTVLTSATLVPMLVRVNDGIESNEEGNLDGAGYAATDTNDPTNPNRERARRTTVTNIAAPGAAVTTWPANTESTIGGDTVGGNTTRAGSGKKRGQGSPSEEAPARTRRQ